MIDDPLVSLLLAPLLIPQGLYTRKVTPKLPEAEGERKGKHGAGTALKLLILGDSAAAGVGVKQQTEALSGQLVSRLSKNYHIDWRLEAQTGVTTAEVIQKLERISAFKTDVVLISLGVNDVTSSVSLKNWLVFQDKLRNLLVTKFRAKHILLSSIPPMSRFPSLPQPLRWYLGRRSSAFNEALFKQSQPHDELEFVDVSFPIEKAFFADDGFHPNHLAYQLWSDIAAERICLKLNV